MLETPSVDDLAKNLLDEKELDLAAHLSQLLSRPGMEAYTLVGEILPTYHDGRQVLEPRNIYRSLNYVHVEAAKSGDPFMVRYFIHTMGTHLETCLYHLDFRYHNMSLGVMVEGLRKQGILQPELAKALFDFNKIFIRAKHLVDPPALPSSLDERTFVFSDGALAFLIMRKLSMQVFKFLKKGGIAILEDWKDFDDKWIRD